MIKKEYSLLKGGRRKYNLHNLLVQYGKGVLPPHGATHEIWNVDVDDCMFLFTLMGIIGSPCASLSAVQPENQQKDFLVGAYTVDYVKMGSLNQSVSDCGVYAVKFSECHALGLELSLVNDDNIKETRHRLLWDLWEAANDQELADRMSKYIPPVCLSSTCEEIL
ncbi:hypothetical protein Bca101_043620 [Brassica carinata]